MSGGGGVEGIGNAQEWPGIKTSCLLEEGRLPKELSKSVIVAVGYMIMQSFCCFAPPAVMPSLRKSGGITFPCASRPA